MMDEHGEISWTFGELEWQLARTHNIAGNKRTAFQSRLKNFHRLGYPSRLRAEKGKATPYSPGAIVEMALAVELTELGLSPERVVTVLLYNWFTVMMCVRMAARSLCEHPRGFDPKVRADGGPLPLSMFVFFDPAALTPLKDKEGMLDPAFDASVATFFYGGEKVVQENVVAWMSGVVRRLSFVNVTAMLDDLLPITIEGSEEAAIEHRRAFFSQVVAAADALEAANFEDLDKTETDFLYVYFQILLNGRLHPDQIDSLAEVAAKDLQVSKVNAERALQEVYAELSSQRGADDGDD